MVLIERKDSTDEKLDDLMIFLIVYSWLSSTLYDLCTYFEPHIINVRGQKFKITYGMFSSVVVTVGDFLGLDVTTRSES